MKCDYCNSDHTHRIFDIHNAGTSISTGSGFGYATDGQVIMTNTTTVSKTLEVAGLEPPRKFSYGNVYIAFVIILFALMNFPPPWMWLLICPALVYATYQYPIIWNHRNRVFPDVMRHYINQWKCGDCKRVFIDPSFKWTEGVRDWVWKEVLARNFMLTKTVKVMLCVAGLFFIYPFILSFSLVRQMPYLGGFLREYLFAFILVTIAVVKAYNAAKKRNAK